MFFTSWPRRLVVEQGFELVTQAVVVDYTNRNQVLSPLGDSELLFPVAHVVDDFHKIDESLP